MIIGTIDFMDERDAPARIDGTEIVMITLIALMVAAVIYACYWLFQIPLDTTNNLATFDQRLERVSKIGLLTVGIVGFPLAIWRSILSYKQTNESIEQGKRVVRQIGATERQILIAEENNLANILEKATSLLGEDQSDARKHAGLALLHYIASDRRRAFVNEALSLLSNFVENKVYLVAANEPVYRAVRYLNNLAEQQGPLIAGFKMVDHELACTFPKLAEVRYINTGFLFDNMLEVPRCTFERCSFDTCAVGPNQHIMGSANFSRCTIKGLASIHEIDKQKIDFKYCDFSGCGTIPVRAEITFRDCFYSIENPPSEFMVKFYGHELQRLTSAEVIERKSTWR